jgi:pimeloyl-ACP methyl ester carboxylesterase
LQKQPRHIDARSVSRRVVFFASIILLSFVFSSSNTIRVKTITLSASDGLEITADEYIVGPENPYILLFHEQGSSRGEYHTIARRLCKLDYNCLAIDLRNGGNNSRVSNETARRCRESRCPTGIEDLGLDVAAAIKYVQGKSQLPVIVFGSGANGSLGLKLAKENDHIRAAVALSPGEYFMPTLKIQDTIAGLKKPVFITASKDEIPYVSELASGLEEEYLTLFEPKQGEGHRGSESLSENYDENTEYWVALILFFRDLI